MCSYIKRQLHDRGFVKLVTCQRVPYPLDTSLNNNAVINGPAAADRSTFAVGQPPNPSTSGQAPIPSNTSVLLSANGTTPSPAGPSSNGECCNLRNTKVTVNGTAVINLPRNLPSVLFINTGKYC